MLQEYTAVYNNEEDVQWDEIAGAPIQTVLRGENLYQTEGVAKVVYDETRLRIYLKAYEKHIYATYLNQNDNVFLDSCLEFFVKPNTDDPRYMNFELNPFGVLLIGIGTGPHDRRRLDEINPETFHIRPCIFAEGERNCWSVSFEIPFAVLNTLIGCSPSENAEIPVGDMTCNFLKCSSQGDKSHFLVWSENGDASQGFHNSGLFGKLKFLAK